jgi:hypothetical protein
MIINRVATFDTKFDKRGRAGAVNQSGSTFFPGPRCREFPRGIVLSNNSQFSFFD